MLIRIQIKYFFFFVLTNHKCKATIPLNYALHFWRVLCQVAPPTVKTVKDDYGSLESNVKPICKFHKEKVRNTLKKTLTH